MRRLFGFSVLMTLLMPLTVAAQTPCAPDQFTVDMATPVSSRINWVGDPVQAILAHPVVLPNDTTLAAGTLLKGKVLEVKPSDRKKPGSIRLIFNSASQPTGSDLFSAKVATSDGWLRQTDQNTSIWQINPNHSTRLLNQKIEQRLGSNRAVWASVLGINENIIPNPTSDTFMVRYNQNDILVGAGDTLTLQFNCP